MSAEDVDAPMEEGQTSQADKPKSFWDKHKNKIMYIFAFGGVLAVVALIIYLASKGVSTNGDEGAEGAEGAEGGNKIVYRIINRSVDSGRREFMTGQLAIAKSRLGLADGEFLNAHETYEREKNDDTIFSAGSSDPIKLKLCAEVTPMAGTFSHIQALLEVATLEETKACLVLEDDVYLSMAYLWPEDYNLHSIIDGIVTTGNQDWGIIRLGSNVHNNPLNTGVEFTAENNSSDQGTFAYLVNVKFAKAFAKNYRDNGNMFKDTYHSGHYYCGTHNGSHSAPYGAPYGAHYGAPYGAPYSAPYSAPYPYDLYDDGDKYHPENFLFDLQKSYTKFVHYKQTMLSTHEGFESTTGHDNFQADYKESTKTLVTKLYEQFHSDPPVEPGNVDVGEETLTQEKYYPYYVSLYSTQITGDESTEDSQFLASLRNSDFVLINNMVPVISL